MGSSARRCIRLTAIAERWCLGGRGGFASRILASSSIARIRASRPRIYPGRTSASPIRACVAFSATTETSEHSLLACDVVCSAFSNCTYDVAYLNYFSDKPLISPVALFFDRGIVDYFHRMVRLAEFPYLKAGLVMAVRQEADLAGSLARAATPEEKALSWQRARKLADPAAAPMRVLDAILNVPRDG